MSQRKEAAGAVLAGCAGLHDRKLALIVTRREVETELEKLRGERESTERLL